LEVFEHVCSRLYLEPTALDAGSKLLEALPQIGSTIDSRPVIPLPAAIRDGEARFLDTDALTFANSSSRADKALSFEMIRVRHEFRPPEYYYVNRSGARRIEIELALAYSAGRSGITFLRHATDTLAIRTSVPLPILFARALHLSGAYFAGIRRAASDDKYYACFTGVPSAMARTIAMKLLTRVEPLAVGDLS
jgi:hypothetical protein